MGRNEPEAVFSIYSLLNCDEIRVRFLLAIKFAQIKSLALGINQLTVGSISWYFEGFT